MCVCSQVYLYNILYILIIAEYFTTHVQNLLKSLLSELRLLDSGIIKPHDSNADSVHVAVKYAHVRVIKHQAIRQM